MWPKYAHKNFIFLENSLDKSTESKIFDIWNHDMSYFGHFWAIKIVFGNI